MKKTNNQLQETRKQAAGEAPPAPPVGKGRAVRVTDKNKTTKKSASKSATPDSAVGYDNITTDTADFCWRTDDAAASASVPVSCL
jgi:hypothetical protein